MPPTRRLKRTHRPLAAWGLLVLLVFLGLTALGGGVELVLFPHGNEYVPGAWLDGMPMVDTWVVPGLVLGIGFGLGSLVAGYGILRRPHWRWLCGVESATSHHWSWAATWLIGIGMLVWILLELIYISERSFIEGVYGAVGLLLVVLSLFPSVRLYLRPRAAAGSLRQGAEP
ncbi:MAG: hypothetical protein AAF436_06585 [Myxococcota bacterium]